MLYEVITDFSLPFSFKKPMAKLLATKIMKTAVKEIGDRKYVLWINNAGGGATTTHNNSNKQEQSPQVSKFDSVMP